MTRNRAFLDRLTAARHAALDAAPTWDCTLRSFEGRYYLYTGGAQINIFSSDDLIEWRREAFVLLGGNHPAVYRHDDGRYHMVFDDATRDINDTWFGHVTATRPDFLDGVIAERVQVPVTTVTRSSWPFSSPRGRELFFVARAPEPQRIFQGSRPIWTTDDTRLAVGNPTIRFPALNPDVLLEPDGTRRIFFGVAPQGPEFTAIAALREVNGRWVYEGIHYTHSPSHPDGQIVGISAIREGDRYVVGFTEWADGAVNTYHVITTSSRGWTPLGAPRQIRNAPLPPPGSSQ